MMDIPAELMSNLIIPLSSPHNFVLVRSAVNRYNTKTGASIDPISVAETLNALGYNIVGILPRKLVITPTPEGLILDRDQILQIVKDNQVNTYPVLQVAMQQVMTWALQNENLKLTVARLARGFASGLFSVRTEEVEDSRALVEKRLYERMVFFDCKYGDEPAFVTIRQAAKEDQENMLRSVVQQVMFIFDSIESQEQLVTKDMKQRYEQRVERMREEEKQARNRKREELFASVEATERWLFGMARHAHREAKRGVEEAAEQVAKSDRARDLLAHHSINLFDFVNKQIDALGDERTLTREIGRIEAPLAVLLTAFAKQRTLDQSPQAIRKDPGDCMYRLLSLWLDAKFVGELPDGAYADVIRNESEYQQRHREKTSEYIRRSSWSPYQNDEMDSFLKDMDRDDVERSERHLQSYESSRAAMLWWKCPTWLKYKILRRHIGDAIYMVGTHSRGFTGKQFVLHLEALIANEERLIKQQNTLLGTIDNNDMSSLDRYLKELTKDGPLSDEMMHRFIDGKLNPESPTTERAEELIKQCKARIRALKEMRDAVNLDFVLTATEREAEIARRRRERSRISFGSLRGFSDGLRW